MDTRFVTWNVRSMYRAGLLRTVAEDISKYELHIVGVQEVALNQQANILSRIGGHNVTNNGFISRNYT
jgi:hypothetical protein